MVTGFRGTFVICSTQTKVDGVKGASLQSLAVGAQWVWHGKAVRVDGPQKELVLVRPQNFRRSSFGPGLVAT